MADADILKSLREQVLDESEPLVGLLRKCLALGAVTDSGELRAWATRELKGYPDDAVVPEYRQLHAPLFVDTMSGPTYTTGQQIDRIQVPKDLRQFVPEKLHLRQPIEDLEQMASREKTIRMTGGGFSAATAMWSEQLDMFQQVTAMYYSILPSTIAGIVGMARTSLVEIVIDMAKDVPLNSLPTRARVDSVVQVHVGSNDKYQVNVGGDNSGIIGQGPGSMQIQNNSVPKELVDLIEKLRGTLSQITDDEQRADAEQAIDDFEESVSEDDPKPEKVKRRWALLERVGTALGTAVLTQTVKEGAPVVTDYLQLLM